MLQGPVQDSSNRPTRSHDLKPILVAEGPQGKTLEFRPPSSTTEVNLLKSSCLTGGDELLVQFTLGVWYVGQSYEVFYWTKIGVTMTFVIDFTQNSGKS